jgi:hypothetical protein
VGLSTGRSSAAMTCAGGSSQLLISSNVYNNPSTSLYTMSSGLHPGFGKLLHRLGKLARGRL